MAHANSIYNQIGSLGSRPVTPWYLLNTSLAQSLVGLWLLNESSGSGLDVIGANPLLDTNAVGSAAGNLYPLARSFTIASTQFLNAADSAAISGGDINMWGAVWCFPSAVNVTSTICGKFNTTGNREWQLAQVNTDVVFQCSPDGTGTANGSITASGVLAANTWTLLVWYHDATNNLIGLSVNGGAFSTSAYSTGIFNSAAGLTVGKQSGGTAYFGGRIQQVALGKLYIPTIQDASFCFNNGLVSGVKTINFIANGGEVDWSPDGTQLVYDKRDENGVYQLRVMKPDGSNDHSISIPAVAGGPSAGVHKGFPAWHPNGNYIVCQAEMESHISTHDLSEPGRGWWNDVWALKADGSQWWKLTNYSSSGNTGVLNARFSHDGAKLFWASRTGAVSGSAPLAVWNLQLADFAFSGGTPTISNVTTLTPGTHNFYESQGFSRDDTKILFTSDPAGTASPYAPDVYTFTLAGSVLTNLSNSATQWDEHLSQARHADKIAYMSSRPYAEYDANDVATIGLVNLKSEVFTVNADGSNRRQVTHFNASGFTEYDSEHSVAATTSWNPDGTRLVVGQLMLGGTASGGRYDTVAGRKIWIVDFNGVYE